MKNGTRYGDLAEVHREFIMTWVTEAYRDGDPKPWNQGPAPVPVGDKIAMQLRVTDPSTLPAERPPVDPQPPRRRADRQIG